MAETALTVLKIVIPIFGVAFAGIIGTYWWLLKHAKNHPNNDEIVIEKLCQSRQDCIEAKLTSIEEITKQGFKNIEKLITDGGYRKPRIGT